MHAAPPLSGARFASAPNQDPTTFESVSDQELLAAFADDGTSLGALPRNEVHEHGYWHEVFHCLVVAHRSGVPTAVLQRRSASKKAFPGLLDLSAAGHILAEETVADGVRELHEELGITPAFADLALLGTFRIADSDPAAEGKNREIVHTFLLRDDRPLVDYQPDPIELAGVADISLDDLESLFAVPGALAQVDEVALDGSHRTFVATVADLVPDVDGYWPAMLQAARTELGEHPRR